MIELKNVEKTYQGNKNIVYALKATDLFISEGEIFGIIGKSGAGKSTLVRCINMLERPSKGSVKVAGQELTILNEKELREARKNIGMIFQHFNLLSSRTVADNIAFPLEISGMPKEQIEREVKRLLELVGLSEKKSVYPSELSGGQKQRVGIARALASKPKVLLCDEATSALDPQTTKSILSLIKEINRQFKLTVVIITHEMQVVKEICDRVAVIEDGRIVENASVFDVFTKQKSKTAKDFISSIIQPEMPESNLFSITPIADVKNNLILRIAFVGKAAKQPIISMMVKQFNIYINILYGNLESIQKNTLGGLIVEMSGEEDDMHKALDYLVSRNLEFEVMGYVAGNDLIDD